MQKIKITTGDIVLQAELYNSPTAKKITKALPITESALRWGGEVYFTVPVTLEIEPDARDVLQPGELGFWPVGHAFCIFWGRTPASESDEPHAAGNVNVFGRVIGDASVLEAVPHGSEITVEAI